MFQIFMEEKAVTICMVSFYAVSIFLTVLLGGLYQNMIKEADNMSATKNKLLKQCKLKFANCYQMNNGVSNIDIFADKFMSRLALGPFSFETIYHFAGQSMLLAVVSAGVGIFRSIVAGKMPGEILPFYIVSFLGLYIYFSIVTVVNIRGKIRVLKINLVDFLENHLAARMQATEENMELLYGETSAGTERSARAAGKARKSGRRTVELMPIDGCASVYRQADGEEACGEHKLSKSREEELEVLLKEYFAT